MEFTVASPAVYNGIPPRHQHLWCLYYYTGFLQYVSPPVAMFSPGDNVTLQFNISNHYLAASLIKTTHWFYNGWCIDCYSYDHYILELNNTRLTILNASESDVGQYEVRVTELNHHTSVPPKCDSMTLDLLQHYALYAPAIYCLTLTEGTYSVILIM